MTLEPVDAQIYFMKNKLVPTRFLRAGRSYTVNRVTVTFERVDGGRKYVCFGVETGGAVAELRLDTKNLRMYLAGWHAYE